VSDDYLSLAELLTQEHYRMSVAVQRMLAISDLEPAAPRSDPNARDGVARTHAALARQLSELIELLRRLGGSDADVSVDSQPTPAGSPHPIEATGQGSLEPDTRSTRSWPVRPPGGPPPGSQRGDSPPSGQPSPSGNERYLLAHLPYRTPQHTDVSLIVRVCRQPANWASAAAPLRVADGGAKVSVLVQVSPGLSPTGPLEQVLDVPAEGDSAPLRFAFQAREIGPQRVRVLAFAGGTFLAELEVEVSVESGGPSISGEPVVASLSDVDARYGEVTLQVRNDGDRTVFQLLSDSYLFEPVQVEATAGDPAAAVERVIGTLRQLAMGRGPYSPGMARRWMREAGIGLWNDVVPELIKHQYWQLRDHITSFTIATSHDVLPWELLHPLRPGSDDGFMVEQFPVLRRVFGQQRYHRMSIRPATYVVSGQAPANARVEIDTLTPLIGDVGVVDELGALLDLVDGGCGPLHFVCHNSFTNESGSSIAMNGGPFVPGLLNGAMVRRSLAARRPLVFLNACRTAGAVPEYSRMTGFAQQFMAAGAGAFVGTLWPVRSDSASVFAHAFYALLRDGEPLGRAAMLARRTAIRDEPDPTWLAYTVYGDPHARAS